MTIRTTPRIVSFALAAIMTWAVLSSIDTLALTERSDAMQMSQAASTTQLASIKAHAPRS